MFRKLLVAMAMLVSTQAFAVTYTYVGSFDTNGGGAAPHWTTNPEVYSGLDAAALLFGGVASDYVISTNASLDASTITFTAWYDGWGDHAGKEFAQSYKLDSTGLGYNGCETAGTDCFFSAYSAYVTDGFSATNYVWRVGAVPEPESIALMTMGLATLVVARGRRRQK
ncbi:PEP-CTERM sorting domain-containing protein [Methylophilus sp. 14]|uniref:PEP-CTERM sorting domain-containing protein n=1 Tax=Methylophilus sp. 14 TaxID=2781019 RepID=UPI00188EC8DF|nr:PEP-CTERM sorting domain-containing protein [Methylophilus sp. 14]MBF4989081.1 PEP-CTERM sorting domain-containing protein [Methylophilus sp. 14]